MALLLELAFMPKAQKPLTDQGLEDTQTKSSQEESTPSVSEYAGMVIYKLNILYMYEYSYRGSNIRVKRQVKRLI